MKKRYIAIAFAVGLLILGFTPIAPVRPFIQLPGEVFPGTAKWPLIGSVFGGLTNTFMSALLVWVIVIIIALTLRARARTADEVPTGFYNFFEMIVEFAYDFAYNIAGEKVKDFFPYFMSFILIILTANWLGLVPGYDSIGVWENKPHFTAEKEVKALKFELTDATAEGEEEVAAFVSSLEATYGIPVEVKDGKFTEETEEELIHEIEILVDADNIGDLQRSAFLLRAPTDEVGDKPEDADWTIVPFFRPAATDLNFTLAYAIIAMVMVQYFGIKYLGAREYFAKFFPFIGAGFRDRVAKNPISAIDPIVGLIELVSEISKVISFGFRLLGNIFAGMVLLFVMSFLLPAANIVFYGLEFFVGLVQALVFALLMLIFMMSATESHHGDEEHH